MNEMRENEDERESICKLSQEWPGCVPPLIVIENFTGECGPSTPAGCCMSREISKCLMRVCIACFLKGGTARAVNLPGVCCD
jgi:hypothetical protein